MIRAVRNVPAAATYALVLALYLAVWAGVATRAAQRGTAGVDFDRRGSQALVAVSMFDAGAALLLTPVLALQAFSRSSSRGRGVRGAGWRGVLDDTWARCRGALMLSAAALVLSTAAALALDARSARITPIDVVSTRVLLVAICALAIGVALLASALCRDVYEAAALAYLVLVLLAGTVVFSAPLLARVSDATRLIAAMLLANPLVAMASATGFDVMRTEFLYRATPVGQRLFSYPTWHTAATTYAVAAVIAVTTTVLIRSREARCV